MDTVYIRNLQSVIPIETLSVDPLEGQFKVQLCSLVGPLVGPNSNSYMLVLNEISF